MKGWTLDYVRSLDQEDYDELVMWINDQSDRAEHGESTDADAIVSALDAKARKADDDGDD